MLSTTRTVPQRDRLVIHHLSDLHYRRETETQRPLQAYVDRLRDPERRPDLIVITGDLTETGDLNDLQIVRAILSGLLSTTPGQSRPNVFVAPGPRDVSWDERGAGFQQFARVFPNFALPSEQGVPSAQGVPSQAVKIISHPLQCVVYPFNTCYVPDAPLDDVTALLEGSSRRYQDFKRQFEEYKRKLARANGDARRMNEVSVLRQRLHETFLELSESSALAMLDAGTVGESDLNAFDAWARQAFAAPDPSSGDDKRASEPLKILITHHPLFNSSDTPPKTLAVVQKRFRRLADVARAAGFHLALHGHIHKPQVLSDLSTLEGPDARHPLRQIGAGSLGESGAFNEIEAIYRPEDGRWRLRMRTVNLLRPDTDPSDTLMLLNPVEDATKQVETLEEAARRRRQFDEATRGVLRQFNEDLAHVVRESARPVVTPFNSPQPPNGQTNPAPLPFAAMGLVKDVIERNIFEGYNTRIGLALKGLEPDRHYLELRNAYLRPIRDDEPPSLLYPASIAALALVLGRSLIFYPNKPAKPLTNDDYEWLKQNDKGEPLRQALEALKQHATRDRDEIQRYEKVSAKLADLEVEDHQLVDTDFYQAPARRDRPRSFPYFISVPIPLRPTNGGPAALPEIGTLNVALQLPPVHGAELSAASDEQAKDIFTAERIEMLEGLSELIAVVLCSSNALGKPSGSWNDTLRPQ